MEPTHSWFSIPQVAGLPKIAARGKCIGESGIYDVGSSEIRLSAEEQVAQEYTQFGPDTGAGFSGQQAHDAGSSGDWSVVLPGTSDSLPQVRRMITEAATRCGFHAEEIAKIEMAVDEACTNIIEHAYHANLEHASGKPLEIEVHAHEHPDRLEITILDHSLHNFPVDEHAPEELEDYFNEHKRRGLGLFIIRSFVDDVQHRFVDGRGNELLLIKYFG